MTQVTGMQHQNSEECVTQTVQQFKDICNRKKQLEDPTTTLTVVELLCQYDQQMDDDERSSSGSGSGGEREGEECELGVDDCGYAAWSGQSSNKELRLNGLARVDDQVRRLYEAAPPGTLLVVVTQGSMSAHKLLASQKMRY